MCVLAGSAASSPLLASFSCSSPCHACRRGCPQRTCSRRAGTAAFRATPARGGRGPRAATGRSRRRRGTQACCPPALAPKVGAGSFRPAGHWRPFRLHGRGMRRCRECSAGRALGLQPTDIFHPPRPPSLALQSPLPWAPPPATAASWWRPRPSGAPRAGQLCWRSGRPPKSMHGGPHTRRKGVPACLHFFDLESGCAVMPRCVPHPAMCAAACCLWRNGWPTRRLWRAPCALPHRSKQGPASLPAPPTPARRRVVPPRRSGSGTPARQSRARRRGRRARPLPPPPPRRLPPAYRPSARLPTSSSSRRRRRRRRRRGSCCVGSGAARAAAAAMRGLAVQRWK